MNQQDVSALLSNQSKRLDTLETNYTAIEKNQGTFNERLVKLETVKPTEKADKSFKKNRTKGSEAPAAPAQSNNGDLIVRLNERAAAMEGRIERLENQKLAPPLPPQKSPNTILAETRELKMAARLALSTYLATFSQAYLPLWGTYILGAGLYYVVQKTEPKVIEKYEQLKTYVQTNIIDAYVAKRVQLFADLANSARLKLAHPVATLGSFTGKITDIEANILKFLFRQEVTASALVAIAIYYAKYDWLAEKAINPAMAFIEANGIDVIGKTVLESSISYYLLLTLVGIGILHTLFAKLATYIPEAKKPVEIPSLVS